MKVETPVEPAVVEETPAAAATEEAPKEEAKAVCIPYLAVTAFSHDADRTRGKEGRQA